MDNEDEINKQELLYDINSNLEDAKAILQDWDGNLDYSAEAFMYKALKSMQILLEEIIYEGED